MRIGRYRFNLRRAMVWVAVIGLVLAYAARYRVYNALADKHQAALLSGPVLHVRSARQIKRVTYHLNNRDRYRSAAIYPWVLVQNHFVPFDPTGLPADGLDPRMGKTSDDPSSLHDGGRSGTVP